MHWSAKTNKLKLLPSDIGISSKGTFFEFIVATAPEDIIAMLCEVIIIDNILHCYETICIL